MVVAPKTGRGRVDRWGYTEDGRPGTGKGIGRSQASQVQVQDGGGDNNRESSRSAQVVIIGYEWPSYILLYLFRRTKRMGPNDFFF
jgi:hypothetical protein